MTYLLILILFGLLFLNISENYSPGTRLQLTQSSPYYTYYDYQKHMNKFPYYYYLPAYPSYFYQNPKINPV